MTHWYNHRSTHWLIASIVTAVMLLWIFWEPNSETPPFISKKLDELTTNKKLMDSIDFSFPKDWEYTFNRNDYEHGDSVRFTITIRGYRGVLKYHAVHRKSRTSDVWTLSNESIGITMK